MATPKPTIAGLIALGLIFTIHGAVHAATPAAPSGAAKPAPAAPTLKFATWTEPNEHAYTIDVPAGWQVTGGMVRRSVTDVRSAFHATSPDGVIHIFIGDPDLMGRTEPNPMYQSMGMREGGVYNLAGGETLIARYLTGPQFAAQYVGWKLCRQPQITQSGMLENETRTVNAQVIPYGRSMGFATNATVGEALFRCGGSEGFVMATTLLARPAAGPAGSWWVYQLAGFMTSQPAQGFFAKYVLSSMLASQKMNPQWEARSAQAAGQAASEFMRMNNAITQSVIQHARQQSALGSAGGWNHPNNGVVPKVTHDPEVERQRDIANRGNRDVCDELGTCKNVDNSATHYWHDYNGHTVAGPESGYPPDYSGQWTPMR